MVGIAKMAAQPVIRLVASFWAMVVRDRFASSAVPSSSRRPSTFSLIRIAWS
jgi:hypothetical protein